MLKYIVSVSEDLLVLAVLTGLAFAFSWRRFEAKGTGRRVVAAGLGLAWALTLVIAILKKSTRLIDSGLWNLRFVGAYLVGLLLVLVLLVPALRDRTGRAGVVAQAAGVALMLVGATGYYATETLTYPNVILLSVKSVISTDFFFRIVGWLLGLVLMLLIALATFKVLMSLEDRLVNAVSIAGMVFVALVLSGLALRAMLTRRIIPQNHTVFQIAVFASNNGLLFGCVLGGLALACVAILVVRSLNVNEPYDNPAQHRKIRAKWRSRRRWATVAVVCLALSLLNVTAVKAYDSREVELSPSEEFELRDDGCYIPLEQVEDGHLHRFTYTTSDGVGVRFIIIKKPGSSSYGIGLDACDICGETGYYERDGQVVCKLCDVVMNIQTIGFKGGCNPIVIEYSIHDGYIIVPFDTLDENAVIFTR